MTPNPEGDVDLAAVGTLLADPARCRVLLALGDGRALPASVLAGEAGVAASTASSHLAKLVDGGMLTVAERGRYRYFTLAGPHVGELIEAVARIAPAQPVRSLRQGTRAHAVRRARTCYDHLAGRLGVALADAMLERRMLTGEDGVALTLTPAGRSSLAELGVDLPTENTVRCCLDWTEQRRHTAGRFGRAVLARLLALDWVRRSPETRAVLVTEVGRGGLHETFGLAVPD